MKRFLILFLILVSGWITPRAHGAEFEYGPRPASAIYDPEARLSPEMAKPLAAELAKIKNRDRVDIIVVALADVGSLPPETVARRFGEAWGNDLLHAVVLDVANREDGPWVYVGGKSIEGDRKEFVPKMLKDILRRARQEPDRDACLHSAVTQTSDLLRYLLGYVVTKGEALQTEAVSLRNEKEKRARQLRILMIGSAVGFLPFCGILFLAISALLRRRPRHFPPILWTRRFGAPYAGGNNATADLGRVRSATPNSNP